MNILKKIASLLRELLPLYDAWEAASKDWDTWSKTHSVSEDSGAFREKLHNQMRTWVLFTDRLKELLPELMELTRVSPSMGRFMDPDLTIAILEETMNVVQSPFLLEDLEYRKMLRDLCDHGLDDLGYDENQKSLLWTGEEQLTGGG